MQSYIIALEVTEVKTEPAPSISGVCHIYPSLAAAERGGKYGVDLFSQPLLQLSNVRTVSVFELVRHLYVNHL